MRVLSGNSLKIIAMISMLIDHMGYIFFPKMQIFRIIGRIAFPVFAFMIGEGCIYTKNKLRYFMGIFLLAVICHIGYQIAEGELYFSVLVTFSLSILIIFSLDKKRFAVSALLIAVIYLLNIYFRIDYGFWGSLLPVFSYVGAKIVKSMEKRIIIFAIGLIILSVNLGGLQYYSLMALPIFFLYSGKRGDYNLKYLFYIFYPTHLLILYAISYMVKY